MVTTQLGILTIHDTDENIGHLQ